MERAPFAEARESADRMTAAEQSNPIAGEQPTDDELAAAADGQGHAKRKRLSKEQTNAESRRRTLARPGVVVVAGEEKDAATALAYVSGGLRRIRPYVFEHNTYAKARWVGRTLVDVLVREFRDRPPAYYRLAIARGLIRVNGRAVPSTDALVANGDMISHAIHRHEPPVAAEPAPLVLHRDDDAGLLVVSKPASVPVHPTGRYRYNTLVEMLLAADDTLPRTLSLVNRLDRLTSGVCVLTTRPDVARDMQQRMESRAYFRKEYVARVRGVFPPSASCGLALRTVEHKLALVVPSAPGDPCAKEASTSFVRLWTDGSAESIVLCRPITGRMHQIRVHLLCLGHPILNDVLYATPSAAEAVRIALPAVDKDVHELNTHAHKEAFAERDARLAELCERLLEAERAIEAAPVQSATEDPGLAGVSEGTLLGDTTEGAIRALCPDCVRTLRDPRPDELCIYLHAWRYSTPTQSFAAPLPPWAAVVADHELLSAS